MEKYILKLILELNKATNKKEYIKTTKKLLNIILVADIATIDKIFVNENDYVITFTIPEDRHLYSLAVGISHGYVYIGLELDGVKGKTGYHPYHMGKQLPIDYFIGK